MIMKKIILQPIHTEYCILYTVEYCKPRGCFNPLGFLFIVQMFTQSFLCPLSDSDHTLLQWWWLTFLYFCMIIYPPLFCAFLLFTVLRLDNSGAVRDVGSRKWNVCRRTYKSTNTKFRFTKNKSLFTYFRLFSPPGSRK